MLVAGLVVIALGVVMVSTGAVISIVEWHRGGPGRRRSEAAADIEAVRRLLKELRRHPLGTQFIAWGVVLILIGGGLAGASQA
jgi:predicted RND superfamily exporter protein